MANIKISEMTEIDELNGEEYVPLIQNGENKKYKISNLIKAKGIITASFSSNHVIATTDTSEKVSLDTSVVEGEKLTLVNNGILIGEGISKIKVSSNINFQTVAAGLKYVTIYKNEEIASQNPITISARTTITTSPVLIDVTEGDMIYLYVQGTAQDTIRRAMAFSNITVEAVK